MFNEAERRNERGQQGGGEWTSSGAGGGESAVPVSSESQRIGAHPALAAGFSGDSGGTAGTSPALNPPAKTAKAEKSEAPATKSFADKLAYTMALNVDDVAVIALKGVIARNPQWFAMLAKFAAAGRLVKSHGLDIAICSPPLTEHAEHSPALTKFDPDEARDDDGRWSAAGRGGAVAVAAAGGGAVSAAGAALGLRAARRKSYAAAKEAAAPILEARKAVAARLAARYARVQTAADSIERGLRRPKTDFLATAVRGLNSQARRAHAELNAHLTEHSEPFLEPGSDVPVWATTDPLGEASHAERVETLHNQIDDLAENGRAPRRVEVAESVHEPHAPSFTRTIRGPRQVRWRDPEALAALIAEDPFYAANGIHSLADAETLVLTIPTRMHGRVLPQYNLPRPLRIVRPFTEQTVRNTRRVIPAHRRLVEGYPDQAGRKHLADQIRDDVAARVQDFTARDQSSVAATHPVTASRYDFRNGEGILALRRLSSLRQHGKTAIIAAGLLGAVGAGAAAYAFLRRHQSPGDISKTARLGRLTPQSSLAKAFNPDQRRDAQGRFAGKPTVTVLIGPPASGKTTWRQTHLPNAVRISSDAILEREGRPVTTDNIDWATKIARREFREAAAAGKDIVIDRTNPTVKSRSRWLSLLPAGYQRKAVVFETHGLERAWRVKQRELAGNAMTDPRLRFVVPVQAPADGEFDHVETVKQGVSQSAIAWIRRTRNAVATPDVTKPVTKLAKAAPESTPPAKPARDSSQPPQGSSKQTVYDAGAAVEDSVANRLARTFGVWTQIPPDQLAEGADSLRDQMASDIQRATRPLDDAAAAGAAADIGVQTLDRDGASRLITLTLDAGSPKVRDFSVAYRVKLAGEIADEQMQTIQSVLQDATLQGQPPAVTARLLRQTIGLTPYQAGHVISFRRQLETLDPNVLNRALRDGRYDKTVSRAIDASTPLGAEQVDAMVEAYHRRYLAYRAMTIARTEGLRSANNGHAAAVDAFTDEHPGFSVVKTWMATEDERTRADHRALDGQQVVGLHTPFVVPGNGDRIVWPHHPEAPLRQTINCRCTFTTSLVPRTTAAQRGFAADDPTADNLEEAAG